MTRPQLVKDRQTKEPATDETAVVVHETLQQGVLLARAGLYGNVIRLLVPLVIAEAELQEGLDAIEQAIAQVSS
jgi:4-aminobutyrate aminotransferase/(S)-3-amino-2-methylpropionate transaminase